MEGQVPLDGALQWRRDEASRCDSLFGERVSVSGVYSLGRGEDLEGCCSVVG